jgi:hypothetical protein
MPMPSGNLQMNAGWLARNVLKAPRLSAMVDEWEFRAASPGLANRQNVPRLIRLMAFLR